MVKKRSSYVYGRLCRAQPFSVPEYRMEDSEFSYGKFIYRNTCIQ